MTAKLSVNINKIALLRNSRKGNYPDLLQYAKDCESFGAEGITVHPRPDERHIRYSDIPLLKSQTVNELNIEGNPTKKFLELVLQTKPEQCTLVPDSAEALTSDHGWNTIENKVFLKDICQMLRENGIRTSLFLDPDVKLLESVSEIGADRIELYTGIFASEHAKGFEFGQVELAKHASIAKLATIHSIGINAGHDLNLHNLKDYSMALPNLLEVSIGHALTVDSIYYGLKNTISMYKRLLNK